MERMFFPVTQKEAERSGVSYSSVSNKSALFPSRLRQLRKEKGVSQDVLSKVLEVSKSTVGLWETGDTLPDAKSLFKLANYYGVSADYLLCLANAKTQDADIRKICEFTGLSEESVESLNKEKSGLDFVLLLINNLILEWSSYLPAAKAAAHCWIQSDISKKGKSECQQFIEKALFGMNLYGDYVSSTPFVNISADDAKNFYNNQAVSGIGHIALRSIKEYKDLRISSGEMYSDISREELVDSQRDFISVTLAMAEKLFPNDPYLKKIKESGVFSHPGEEKIGGNDCG